MQPIKPTGVIAALDALGMGAKQLADVELPTLFAGVVDRSAGVTAVQRVLVDAEHAASLLADGSFGVEPLRGARMAVTMLENASIDTVALRDLGVRVQDVVHQVRNAPAFRAADAADLMSRARGKLEPEQWQRLHELVASGDAATAGVPATMDGAPPLVDLTAQAARDGFATDDLQRYATTWRMGQLDDAGRTDAATAILRRDFEELTPSDWHELGVLLDAGAIDDKVTPAIREVVTKMQNGVVPDITMRQPLEAFAANAMTPHERLMQVDELARVRPEDLTPRQWQRLGALLDADATIPMPRTINRSGRVSTYASSRASGVKTDDYDSIVSQHFEQYRTNRLPDSMRREEAARLMTRRASDLSEQELTRLVGLLDSDPKATVIDVPREFARQTQLEVLLRAKQSDSTRQALQRYFDHFAVRQLDPETRVAQAHDLMGRDPATLESTDWARLSALLGEDAKAELIKLPRKLNATTELAALAKTHATGSKVEEPTRRYFDAYVVSRQDPAHRAAQATALLERDPATLTSDDWMRLGSILELDPKREMVNVPRQIDRLTELVPLTRSNTTAKKYLPVTDVYIERWRVDQLPEPERIALATDLLHRRPEDLTRSDWLRLRALVDGDAKKTVVTIPTEIKNHGNLSWMASSSADKGAPADGVQHYFDRVLVDDMDLAARTAQADELLRRDPTTLAKEDWRRLATLLEADAKSPVIDMPRTINRAEIIPIARKLSVGNGDTNSAGEFFRVYVANHRPAAERTAIADALLRRDPASLSKDEWRQLVAYVSTDKDGAIAVQRSVKNASNFLDLARTSSTSKSYSPSLHHYFERYAIKDLTPEQRAAQAAELLGRDPATLSSQEWYRFGALLDADAESKLIDVPRSMSNTNALEDVARAHANGSGDVSMARRYFDRYAVNHMDADARLAQGNDLLRRDPASLTKDEWNRLATLLETSPADGPLKFRQTVDGLSTNFASTARYGATNPKEAAKRALPFFEHVIVADLAPEARIAQVDALLARSHDSLSPEEWRRLGALLDDDAVQVARSIPMTSAPFGKQTFSAVARTATPDVRQARHFFELAAVSRMTPDVRAQTAAQIMHMPTGEITSEQWARLSALLEHAPGEALVKQTRFIEGTTALRELTRQASFSKDYVAKADRYLARALVEELAPAERVARLESLLSRPADQLSQEDWRQALAIIDSEPSEELTRIVDLLDRKPLTSALISKVQNRKTSIDTLQRFADEFQVSRITPEARLAEANTLMGMRAKDLSSAQASRLRALLKADPDGTLIPTVRSAAGMTKFFDALHGASNGNAENKVLQYYFDVNELQKLPAEQIKAEAHELLMRTFRDLTRDEWARLSKLLEADVDGTAIDVPRKFDNLSSFNEIARNIANKRKKPDAAAERFFTMWKDVNDPTYRARLTAAINSLVAGTADETAKEMIANEWWRMEQHVAGRPVHHQAAIAMVMMGTDKEASNRGVLRSLEFARSGLKSAADVPTELEPVRVQTLELLDRNISRLKGKTPAGAVRGYSNHPDYAEVGRIRANLVFLDHARNVLPPEVENDAAQGAAELAGTAGSATEKLTW